MYVLSLGLKDMSGEARSKTTHVELLAHAHVRLANPCAHLTYATPPPPHVLSVSGFVPVCFVRVFFLPTTTADRRIRPEAEKFGICKIIPPDGWNPGFHFRDPEGQLFPTKLQVRKRRGGEDDLYLSFAFQIAFLSNTQITARWNIGIHSASTD